MEAGNYTSFGILVEYNDLISGTITFLNIFLGIIQVFDYILMIPIVVLSFSVLIFWSSAVTRTAQARDFHPPCNRRGNPGYTYWHDYA
ncbi:MAG: hypothetical protein CM1200mP21_02230 [Candidatus Poseidoniales archaeon]|nr:MAG: hypothetical protein CM1200mP21_02230 [Candidatus Poseidoniales archaeon]